MRNFGVSRQLLAGGGAAAALALILGVSAQAQTPILTYQFNDTGATTKSTGSDSQVDTTLGFYNPYNRTTPGSSTSANLHGAAGSGVTGAANDIAFDNSSATGMGGSGVGGAAVSSGSISQLNGTPMTAMTICGWFKTDPAEAIDSSARLVEDANSVSGTVGFFLIGTSGNRLQFGINTQKAYSGNVSAYAEKGVWTFFAATYDSSITDPTQEVNFYAGYRPGDVDNTTQMLLSPSVVNVGISMALGASPGSVVGSSVLGLGNGTNAGDGTNRVFDGSLDNISIYNTALTQSQLESVRLNDLGAPEPSQTAALGLGVLGLAGLLLRARKAKQSA